MRITNISEIAKNAGKLKHINQLIYEEYPTLLLKLMPIFFQMSLKSIFLWYCKNHYTRKTSVPTKDVLFSIATPPKKNVKQVYSFCSYSRA